MKFSAVFLVVAQAFLIQNAYTQVIRASLPSAYTSTICAEPSVANSLADTLSLLTVSSLLSETLPLNPTLVASCPSPCAAPAIAPVISYDPIVSPCGCGRYGYGSYLI